MTAPASVNTGFRSPESGMVIMTLAMALVPFGDALSKSLTTVLNPFEIGFWRYFIQAVALALVLVLVTRKGIRGGPVGLILLGGIGSVTTLVAIVGAFAVMPIATAIALFFIEPLLLTILSAVFLREKTGLRRYAAVFVGLLGALVVIRPGWDAYGWATLLPLVAALAFALTAIAMRSASQHMDSASMQFWFAVVGSGALGAGLLLTGGMTLVDVRSGLDLDGPWLRLLAMGMLSSFTFFLISEAFRRTPASTLAPFQYLEIVGATILGYVIFGDFPDFWTWVGTAIILASGLYVFHRERKQNRAVAPESLPQSH